MSRGSYLCWGLSFPDYQDVLNLLPEKSYRDESLCKRVRRILSEQSGLSIGCLSRIDHYDKRQSFILYLDKYGESSESMIEVDLDCMKIPKKEKTAFDQFMDQMGLLTLASTDEPVWMLVHDAW